MTTPTKKWYMLTLVGSDQAGIVSKATNTLLKANCNLGEASMMRLGNSFNVMLMVNSEHSAGEIKALMADCCHALSLHLHIDEIEGTLHNHHIPNVQVIVTSADREGIVAQVSKQLFEAGMDILDLNSDVAGTKEKPIYIMQIEGMTSQSIDKIEKAMQAITHDGLDIHVHSIDTIIG